ATFREFMTYEDVLVRASNDANVAATGEVFRGAAVGKKNVVMFTLGTGVGGGVVVDGKLVDGKNGAAGELGHLVIDFTHKILCKCGKHGCLETVSSATGIVNLARIHLQSSSVASPLRSMTDFSAKRVLDLAKAGDSIALAAVDDAADYLGRAIAGVLLSLNPEVVLIGGGVSHAGPFFLDKVAAKAQEYSSPFAKDTPIIGATLGNDAGMFGAAYLVR
ncbi:MAG: ROK family protein, partial [Bacillota bacterium]|nr:ROK family protein [Bacillota bacterium]